MTQNKKDYTNGKIYEIVCLITGERYIGHTCYKYLSQRLQKHKYAYKEWKKTGKRFVTSFPIIERGNFQILLIEKFACQSIEELLVREGYWINQKKCVNKVICGRTPAQYKKDNKDKVKIWKKNDRERRKEAISQYLKVYREQNKTKLAEKDKVYYQKKKKDMLEKVKCECGREVVKCSLTRHKKSNIHLELLKNITS